MALSKDLLTRIKDITNNSLTIMNDKQKGDINDILNQVVIVNDYAFSNGQDGSEYVIFTIESEPNLFFFGSSVVTENFKTLDDLLTPDVKQELLECGLPMKIEVRKSKTNRRYTVNTFYPN